MKTTKRNQTGLTLIELLVIIAVIAIFASMIGIPRPRDKARAKRIQCTSNLKQVGLAFRISQTEFDIYPQSRSVTNRGAMESLLAGNVAAVFQVMSNELVTPKILFCPTDKKRIQANSFGGEGQKDGRGTNYFRSNTNVSYFVGVDAKDTSPQMFLAGDDNFLIGGERHRNNGMPVQPGVISLTTNIPVAWSDERHEKQGNIGLADGSVQGFSSSALLKALANTGDETNRLAMP